MADPMYFTPSEVVLLNGEHFAPSASVFNKYEVLASGQGVNANKLAVAVWSAALLANEQYGLIRLTPSVNSTLFGLVKTPTLLVEPTNVQAGWPAGTLEAELLGVASRLQATRQNNLHMIVYSWLGSDYGAPYQIVLKEIEQGLGKRGLMVEEQAKALGLFKYKKLVLPDSSLPLIAQQPFAPVQQMLQQCEQFRPDVWKTMQKNIDKAISQRTEQSDSD
jgi:hypothetical protein